MRATRITANLRVADLGAAKAFYADYLGLSDEEFNLGWVARHTSPETGAHVQLVTADATAREDSVISVHTEDVDGAFEEAQQLGYEIVHPLTTQSWGVRRFFVRAPGGRARPLGAEPHGPAGARGDPPALPGAVLTARPRRLSAAEANGVVYRPLGRRDPAVTP